MNQKETNTERMKAELRERQIEEERDIYWYTDYIDWMRD